MTHGFTSLRCKEFLKDKNGNLKGVKIVKLSWEKDEKSGRMVMKEVQGSEKTLPAEVALIAAGFLGCQSMRRMLSGWN